MKPISKKQRISLVYLTLVPFAAIILAFVVGHISYKIYVPIWIINAGLMATALWTLGGYAVNDPDALKKNGAIAALFLAIPWLFITIFFGMGPPPTTMARWVETALEQEIRYVILIGTGVLITFGLVLLRDRLKLAGEHFYSLIGLTAFLVAVPLFILDMAYWGSYLTESFTAFVVPGKDKHPDWYMAMRSLFYTISTVTVALIYVSTACFAASLKITRLLKPGTCNTFIILSSIAFILNIIPPSSLEPLNILSYFVSIPAVSFLIFYIMALQILRRLGNGTAQI